MGGIVLPCTVHVVLPGVDATVSSCTVAVLQLATVAPASLAAVGPVC